MMSLKPNHRESMEESGPACSRWSLRYPKGTRLPRHSVYIRKHSYGKGRSKHEKTIQPGVILEGLHFQREGLDSLFLHNF